MASWLTRLSTKSIVGIVTVPVIALGVWTYRTYHHQGEGATSIIEVSTVDSPSRIVMPDSSKVYLNKQSTLAYPPVFTGSTREIQLYGDGYFEVQASPEAPFVVHTGMGSVEAVGTAFQVTRRADSLAVAVAHGTVNVEHEEQTVVLHAGMAAKMKKGSATELSTAEPNAWGFATGRFVFTDAPLHEVVDVLGRSYLADIEIEKPSARECKINATFESIPLEEILGLIAESLNLTLTQHENKFTLAGEGCR